MKATMASYYHEARAQVRALKTMTEDNQKRAQRRAEVASVQAEQPMNLLRVDGRSCKLFRDTAQYHTVENQEGMIPWNGQEDNLIDRFDGRALLDMYREPDPRLRKPKTADELELEELLAFEAYRDLVKLARKAVSDEQGIAAAIKENIALRASAKSAATAALGLQQGQASGPMPSASAIPAGFGAYGAVGFAYSAPAGTAEGDSQSESEGSEEGEESEEQSEDEEEVPLEADAGRADSVAAGFGVGAFSVMLRRALRQEAAEAEGRIQKPRRRFGRKKAAERAKRMAGQGLVAPKLEVEVAKPTPADLGYRSARRSSPTYEDAPWHRRRSRERSRSRSPSGGRHAWPRTEFITSFSVGSDGAGSRHVGSARYAEPPASSRIQQQPAPPERDPGSSTILEALPDRADPAGPGPVSLPAAASVMRGVRPEAYWDKQREAERHWRYDSRRKERDRDQRNEAPESKAATPKPAAVPAAAAAAAAKETPKERLKRLMAAQFNKQIQKDTLSSTQKKAQEEKDRLARLTIERAALDMQRRSPSPRLRRRSHSRSRTPSRSRSPPRRSRQRSRSRSRDRSRHRHR